MKRLFITGASGLLGLNLALQLGEQYEVFGVLRKTQVVPAEHLALTPLYGDLAAPGVVERLLDEARPDVVIHCAAMTDMDRCEQYPEEAALINTTLPQVLAAQSAQRGIYFLHISTDAVFDGVRGDYDEGDEPHPINVYAQTKLDGERRVAEANPDAAIARVNFYGWSWLGRRSLAEWFFNNLSARRRIRGFTNITFCPLLVNDLIDLLVCIAELRLSGLYHVVSPEPLSKCDFGRLLARRFGMDEDLVSPSAYGTGDLRAPRARLLNLRSDKLAKALRQPLPSQQQAMDHFFDQYCQGTPQKVRSALVNLDLINKKEVS